MNLWNQRVWLPSAINGFGDTSDEIIERWNHVLYRKNFDFYVNGYLNYLYYLGANLYDLTDYHFEMLRFLPIMKRILIEIFRGGTKTEFITQCYATHKMLSNNQLIVVAGAKEDQPKQNLRNIKRLIRGWDVLQHLYDPQLTWQQTAIECTNGTQVFVKSMLSDWRGMKNEVIRPSLVILDDPTPDKLQRPLEDYVDFVFDSIIPGLDENGQLIVCGTPVHYDDLVMQLRENEAFTKMNVPIWNDAKVPSWPAKYPVETIERMKKEFLGKPLMWAKNYLLLLTDIESGAFSEYIPKDFVGLDWKPDRSFIRVLAVDPALKKSEVAPVRGDPDYFALCVIDFFHRKSLWRVVNTYHGRLTFSKSIKKVIEWSEEYKPKYVVIETNFNQSIWYQQLKENTNLPVVSFEQTRDKIERIMELSPYLDQHKIHFTKQAFNNDFAMEFKVFPDKHGKFKVDMLDAFHLAFFYSLNHGSAKFLTPLFGV